MNIPETITSLAHGTVNCGQVPAELFSATPTFPVFAVRHGMPSPSCVRLSAQSAVDPAIAKRNRTIQLTLEALAGALADARLDQGALQAARVGIVLGTTVGCTFNDEEYYINWRRGRTREPDRFALYLESNIASFLQAFLGVRGPRAVITNACASGTDAIGIGRNWLQRGACDIVIAGGADALSRISYYGFAGMMLMSESPCRPFAMDRDGLNIGEGAALLVLEDESKGEKRGADVHGWISGYGTASDCYHPTSPHPEGRGLQTAFRQARADAGIDKSKIGCINAHGTGTIANDQAEMAALARLGLTDCPVVSTKGITGHMLGAAGAMEAILTIVALKNQETRGTVGCKTPDPDLARPPFSEQGMMQLRSRIGISQSLAFGGTNSVLVLEAA